MSKLETKLNARSADFQANAAAMRALVDDLHAQFAKVEQGGGEAARAKHTARGKLLPRDRVAELLDPARRSWSSRRWPRMRCTSMPRAPNRRPAPASSPASAA
jgi:acetyl-CoA carboxylase carboxyltransferase component